MNCPTEPWGRYSASGGLYYVDDDDDKEENGYIYSFGGDTSSDADNRNGGVVRTNFRYSLKESCWQRIRDSPTKPIGYRATAIQLLDGNNKDIYIFGGSDRNRNAVNDFWKYSLIDDQWMEINDDRAIISEDDEEEEYIFDRPTARWKHAAVAISDSEMFLMGGRRGQQVLQDAWIFNANSKSWKQISTNTSWPSLYRHGMTYDNKRNVVWIFGGLNEKLQRPTPTLWSFNLTSQNLVLEEALAEELPPKLASHAMEYVKEIDVLILWGGTCNDDSELHVYDPIEKKWCRIFPQNRPEKRDAMLWSLKYPYFYIAQGDVICYNRQVLTIADVHRLDLLSSSSPASLEWEMLYEPYNIRGNGNESYCDGTNAGSCQPSPLYPNGREGKLSTCSATILEKFTDTVELPDGGFVVCFPGDQIVTVKGLKGEIPMKELQLGDKVYVGNGKYEEVYSFGHFDPDIAVKTYLEIYAVSENNDINKCTNRTVLRISRDHMIYSKSLNSFVPSSKLNVGDQLLLMNDKTSVASIMEIQSIKSNVRAIGAYAPFTASGQIVVNGILASTYIALEKESDFFVSQQWLAHSFCFPRRFIYRFIYKRHQETYDGNGVSTWVSIPLKVFQQLLKLNTVWKNIILLTFVIPMFSIFTLAECFLSAILGITILMRTVIDIMTGFLLQWYRLSIDTTKFTCESKIMKYSAF